MGTDPWLQLKARELSSEGVFGAYSISGTNLSMHWRFSSSCIFTGDNGEGGGRN